MLAVLRPFLARVAAAVIGAVVAWLAAKGIEVPAATQAQLIEATIGLMLGVFGIVYAIVHRLIDRKLNPADTAASSPTTAPTVVGTTVVIPKDVDPRAVVEGLQRGAGMRPFVERGDETGG